MPARSKLVAACRGYRQSGRFALFPRHINELLPRQVAIDVGINVILAVSLNLVNGYTGQFSLGHAGFMAVGGLHIGGNLTFLTSRPAFFRLEDFAFGGR